jgi:hypothetical protein
MSCKSRHFTHPTDLYILVAAVSATAPAAAVDQSMNECILLFFVAIKLALYLLFCFANAGQVLTPHMPV